MIDWTFYSYVFFKNKKTKNCTRRWKTQADDYPIAYPYVEFRRGLLLEIERTNRFDDHWKSKWSTRAYKLVNEETIHNWPFMFYTISASSS